MTQTFLDSFDEIHPYLLNEDHVPVCNQAILELPRASSVMNYELWLVILCVNSICVVCSVSLVSKLVYLTPTPF